MVITMPKLPKNVLMGGLLTDMQQIMKFLGKSNKVKIG
jgi:hypothetical protein